MTNITKFPNNLTSLQGYRKVKKFGGANSNVVGIVCPSPLIVIGLTDLPRTGGPLAPPIPIFTENFLPSISN